MNKFLVLIIIIAVLVAGIYFFNKKSVDKLEPEKQTPTVTQDVSPKADKEELDKLLRGGASYADKNGVYTILYPNDYIIDEMNNGEMVRIYKKGPTQSGQTEMYDGVIIHLQSISLNGKTLSKWVDEQVSQSTSDGTTSLTSPKKAILLNKYPGFTYKMRGLGEFVYIVFQKDSASNYAVSITTLVADPQNVGFQKEVDAALSTLQLLK